MTTENVESLLTETFELEFVLVMDLEPYNVSRGNGEFVDGIVEFGIVGDEPVDDSERDARFAIDNGHHGVKISWNCVKLKEIFEK